MFCERCGAQLPEGIKFCPNCGNRVYGESEVNSIENAVKPKTKKRKNKRKKKKSKILRVLIALLCCIFIVVIVGGVLILKWYTSDEQSIVRALEDGNYDEAMTIYSENYEGSTESIESILSQRLKKIKTDYASGDMEYAVATMELDAIEKMKIDKINEMLDETRDFINSLNQSRMAFDTAEKYFEEESYVEAIKQYRLVSEDDSNYDIAMDKLEKAVDKYREQILAESNSFIESGSYQEAMNKIKEAMDLLPNDVKLQPEYEKCCANYVDNIIAEVNALIENGDYDGAIIKINETIKAVGTNEKLQSKLDEVKENKPVLLSSLTPINGGWSWNEGTPTDPFGVTYSNASNFVILNMSHSDAGYTGQMIDTGNSFYGIYESYAEYRIYGEYAKLSFDVGPNSEIGEDLYGVIKVYADDTLVYTSPQITRKTDIQNYQVDISNADYVKIVVDTVSDSDAILLMNCILSK